MAGTLSHLCTCFCVERMKISMFRTTTEKRKREREREIDSPQLDATGLFPSPVWFNQSELCLTILHSTGGTALPPARKLNIAAQDAENRQFLVFHTTAYTVQFRTEGAGGASCQSARSENLRDAPETPARTRRAKGGPGKRPRQR